MDARAMRAPIRAIAAVCAALVLGGLRPVMAEPVRVFAAASLRTALDVVAADWTAAGNPSVSLTYAGSAALARQIIEGAPADVFLTASPEWMDAVEAAGLLVPGTRRDLLGNTLVLIGQGAEGPAVTLDPSLDLAALLGDGRLAMGMVDSVPAGVYGREALSALGLWDEAEPRVAQAADVRAALALVAAGEVPYGIAYLSDARAAREAGEAVHVAATFPPGTYGPVTYPVALVRDTAGARAFLDTLASPGAAAVFAAQGFLMRP